MIRLKAVSKSFFTIAGVIFMISILIFIVLYLFAPIKPFFTGIVSVKDAKNSLDKYNSNGALMNLSIFGEKTYCVVHSYDSVKNYVDNIFPKLKAKYKIPAHLPNYKWEVGFYPIIAKDDNGESRIGFYIIPTLVKRVSGQVYIAPYEIGGADPSVTRLSTISPSMKEKVSVKGGGDDDFIYNYGNMNP